MATTALKITATSNGSKVTTTINDVNPNATNAQLAQLGNKFNAFTTNFYAYSEKITTVNVDTQSDG